MTGNVRMGVAASVVALVIVAALGVAWTLGTWPFERGLPRYISWCTRDWERSNLRSLRALPAGRSYIEISTTDDGDLVFSPLLTCESRAPVSLFVQHDGRYQEYGLLGAP